MRWDDLQLLQRLDESEQSGSRGHAQYLLQRLNETDGLPWMDGAPEFARELILAQEAGFVTWTDRTHQFRGCKSDYGPRQLAPGH